MKRLPKITSILLIALYMLALAAVSEASWRLDEDPDCSEPIHFRMASDDWRTDSDDTPPSRTGLDNLRASGSAQLTAGGFASLYAILSAAAPGSPIYIVDLRQESHGFADGIPVSWHEKGNHANAGKTVEEIKLDEAERLSSLVGNTTTFAPKGKTDKKLFESIKFAPTSVKTEEEIVTDMGFRYARIYATDKTWPSDEAIEDFLKFIESLPDGAWLHFHCHAGHGRTTSFMAMYDMIRNPDVSADDIIKRQYLIGGIDLTAMKKSEAKNEMIAHRLKVLHDFSRYIKSRHTGETSLGWSEWKSREAG